MGDLLFIAVTVAFFAVAVGMVKLCERIVGPDLVLTTETESKPERRAA